MILNFVIKIDAALAYYHVNDDELNDFDGNINDLHSDVKLN